jgi:hypothetical protein
MVVSIRRLGTPITRPLHGASAKSISNTTLQVPLEQCMSFTSASIYLSCMSASGSTVSYSIDEALHTSPVSLRYCLDSMEILRIEGYNTETFHFWRTAQSIRHKLFLQQISTVRMLSMPHQCLASPTLLHGESASHLDYPKRQHIMLQPWATSVSKANRLPSSGVWMLAHTDILGCNSEQP